MRIVITLIWILSAFLSSTFIRSRSVFPHHRYVRETQDAQHPARIHTTFHPSLFGLRVEEDADQVSKGYDNGVPQIIAEVDTKIRLFGKSVSFDTAVKFTHVPAERGSDCSAFSTTEAIFVQIEDQNSTESDTGIIIVKLETHADGGAYYVCVKDRNSEVFIHQGTRKCLQIKVVPRHLIPLWIQIILIIVLQSLSGLFSGLNLGLLSLDPTELAIVASVGASKEKKYAKNIIPLRKKGNFLLCSLVIGNVLVNSTLTILLDDLTSGLYAVIFSTIGIVLFGEIVPQALCNRFGLAIGSATRYITRVVMLLTCIISWPLSKVLDFLLGKEMGTVYDRERLVELIRVTKDHNLLDNEEMNIISGTLSLKRKLVTEILTPLDDVFMLPYDAVLDFDTLAEITKEGFTRIPVYEKERKNIVGLLNIKDLALLDPDDCTAVKTLCKYYSYELCFVDDDVTLDVLLETFKTGKSHMAFVQRLMRDPEKDPYYDILGVVTLEDVIEEMIQAEILDETDQHPNTKLTKRDLTVFKSRPLYSSLITPQLQHASFQFLSTTIEPFRADRVSEKILKRLIRQPDVARFIKVKPSESEPHFLYQAGKPADYFVLILEGRVEVKIGVDGLVFESGPFTYFGVRALSLSSEENTALTQAPFPSLPSRNNHTSRINLERGVSSSSNIFVPDFTVYAVSDVLFLRIRKVHYIAAIRATILEKQGKLYQEDSFDKEMEQCAEDSQEEPSTANSVTPPTVSSPNGDLPHDNSGINAGILESSRDDFETSLDSTLVASQPSSPSPSSPRETDKNK